MPDCPHPPALILASASPRRAELLRQIGVAFSCHPVYINEDPRRDEDPLDYVRRLAEEKARAGLRAAGANGVVLGSDTAVIGADGRLMGKPRNEADAVTMLMQLSGRTHRVATGVALAVAGNCEVALVTTEVTFRTLARSECQAYWATREPQDKAGAYGIQGLGAVFVSHIAGSYSAVVGLPLKETADLLARFGIPVWQPVANGPVCG